MKTHAALAEYVREIAAVLGLSHWSLRLPADEYAEEGTHAHCVTIDGRRDSVIRFERGWAERDDLEIRNTVVHELLHCQTADLCDVVRVDLAKARSLAQSEFDVLNAVFARHEELMVDALAAAIAPLVPLPKWGKPCRRS